MKQQRKRRPDLQQVMEQCLTAFVRAGTLDLSLDQLADRVGISKRMLIHYFGGREQIEEKAMTLLEQRLRQQFGPENFGGSASAINVVTSLWERTTAHEARGVLLLVMDLSRRAWTGSSRAKAFYAEQQRLWVQLLMRFLPSRHTVEEFLQLFQGAVLAFLVTGDPKPGKRSLLRFLSDVQIRPASSKKRRGR
jgi:AcrR family transcriptional regulator